MTSDPNIRTIVKNVVCWTKLLLLLFKVLLTKLNSTQRDLSISEMRAKYPFHVYDIGAYAIKMTSDDRAKTSTYVLCLPRAERRTSNSTKGRHRLLQQTPINIFLCTVVPLILLATCTDQLSNIQCIYSAQPSVHHEVSVCRGKQHGDLLRD